ncbi:unnamed protein product [Rotaria sp. Silwood1]|nr:unnamed protein product [Rotaria sp. Silwood1]CAF4608232.1 unnamed protein product [Rotaria sp. Silwood1]CAF4954088.1 unnamed protein product [Rotaria sp. Silwood1]
MFGALRIQGNKFVDENNYPVQLKGMSLYWSQWSTPFYNANTLKYLVSNIKSSIIRAAMGVQQDMDGYLDGESTRIQAVRSSYDCRRCCYCQSHVCHH